MARVAYKQMSARNLQTSVTSMPKLAPVTPVPEDSPAKCHARLAPWLACANLAGEFMNRQDAWPLQRPFGYSSVGAPTAFEVQLLQEFSRRFATVVAETEFPEELQPRLAALLRLPDRCVYSFASDLYSVLGSMAHWKVEYGDVPLGLGHYSAPVALDIEHGRLKVAATGLFFDTFLPLLEQIAPERIGRCAVCERVFYAQRGPGRSGKFGTKSCSRKCNQARRQRERRKRATEYEQTRKSKT
jgi:hypothetical protein